jgi:hypothetical protein
LRNRGGGSFATLALSCCDSERLFELIQLDPSPQYDGKRYQVEFTAADIRTARADLIKRGVTPLSAIEGEESGSPNVWCYFRDPEGNVFEITEWLEASNGVSGPGEA